MDEAQLEDLRRRLVALKFQLEAAGRRRLRRLVEVEGALRRLDAGEYGDCASCGEPISPGRLQADPTSTRCIECAAEHGTGEAQ
jgi:RNA polymerase-binding transcription factor DksA